MSSPQPHEPSRRDRLKPVELVGLPAVLALFLGLVVLMVTHEPIFAGIAFGIAFIVALVSVSLFMLSIKPDAFENSDLHEQDEGN